MNNEKRCWDNIINNIVPINPCDECRWRGICNATVPCGMC